jgi:hypothetical protein
MYSSRLRILLILTFVWISAGVAHATLSEPGRSKSRQNQSGNATHADPCWTSSAEKVMPSVAPWRAQINRRTAIYVIQHVQNSCRIPTESSDRGTQPAPLVSQLNSIRDDLYATILNPIYHSHPGLKNAALPELPSQKVPRATPRDIRRATATRISGDLTRIQRRISKLGEQSADQQANKEAAEKALQHSLDAMAELSFAEKIAFDAYPDLFAKKFDAIPDQPRTQESDETFRKRAPPLGSVRLSDSALAFVRSFMQQVRRAIPQSDQIASIQWVIEQRSKGPSDANWINQGAGWVLGAYSRTHVPRDVIDKVGGIEIVFSAEDDPSSSLMGKTIEVANRKFFIRD